MKKLFVLFVLGVGLMFCASSVYADFDVGSIAQGCMNCHKDGNSGKKHVLTTLSRKDFLDKMKEYRDGDGGSFMSGKAKKFSPEQTEQLADYFQIQKK